jgi:hypothetical protein
MGQTNKPYIRKTGTYVRVKTYSGREQPIKYRYDDIGEAGHTQRLAGQLKNKKWITYGYIFKKIDVKSRRSKTMKILHAIGVKEEDLKKIGL